MPANSTIPFPRSSTEAPSTPVTDLDAASNAQPENPKRVRHAGYGQDGDPLLTVEDVAARLNVTKDWVWDHSSRNTPNVPVIRLSDGVSRFCLSESGRSGSLPAPNNKTVGAVWFRRQDDERSLEPVKRGVSICS